MALLYTAKKYDIQLLLDRCIAFLTRTLDIENIWMIMDHALNFDERRLFDNCCAFIKRNTSKVLQCQKLFDLPKSTMKVILLEAFERVNPLVCYDVVKKWAQNQLGVSDMDTVTPDMIRETAGDLFTAVKCSGMPLNTFINQVATDGILSETDTNSIVTEISSKDPLLKEISFKRFEGINREGWYHDDGQYGFSFNVSKSVMLTGIGLYLPLTETDKLSGLVEIYDESNLAHKQDVQLEHDLFKTYIKIPLWIKISVKLKRTYSV